ncbi:hypothetical protein SAMN06295981_0232 [Corynebacterium pollutisoli]|mgnify:CR=1 FL=1|jgi:acyl CoA:acetate/3-ketoacid CoA transferase beta subunit|uniref:Uncharacterized protein n=1 Tax=Corynebacterium pollutisoli TaxID=1610489 RepID=A0A1X7HZD8_9CORY|nr:hypothetical protein [Corynebacterium pollutisoli]NLP38626.1 hypothetical protein [Corynebacterium pollutisoli]SMG07197.1 hypothetical protein SAMN06295981_0232 [Corynebacterium pollutisoli]HJD78163.1 hypothetical protein [Corynebacterium pollutisoli]
MHSNREHVTLSTTEVTEFDRLATELGVFEVSEERVLHPGILTQVYGG